MRRWIVACLMVVGACLEPAARTCDDGRVCPASTVCDVTHGLCVLADQLTSCNGLDEMATCSLAGTATGLCRDGVCLKPGCGDSFVEGAEQCDGPISDDKDDCTEHSYHSGGKVTCTDQCTFDTSTCAGYCGDGMINGDEACDPADATLGNATCSDFGFYSAAGLKCSAACTFDTSDCAQNCGDGVRNGQEQCDKSDLGGASCTDVGFYQGTLGCTPACTYATGNCVGTCGDGAVNGTEECDMGDLGASTCADFGFYDATTIQCTSVCTYDISQCTGYCGDGIKNGQEACDAADLGGKDCRDFGFYSMATLGCNDACSLDVSQCSGFCGDRVPNGEELCDGLPAATDCQGLGYEYGPTTCSGLCGIDFSECRKGFLTPSTLVYTNGSFGEMYDSWGSGPNNIFVVGYGSTAITSGARIARYNGTSWSVTNLAATRLRGVWGFSPTDVITVGDAGKIFRYNGASWTAMTSSTTETLYGVWGSSTTDVFAVGANGTILHYDGNATAGGTWVAMTAPPEVTGVTLRGVGGWSSQNVFVVGDLMADNTAAMLKYSAGAWAVMATGRPSMALYGAFSPGVSSVWAYGSGGTILAGDGFQWTPQNQLTALTIRDMSGSDGDLYAVAGSGTFAAGNNAAAVLHYDGISWTQLAFPTQINLMSAWGGSGNAYVFGNEGANGYVARYTGEGWGHTGGVFMPAGVWSSGPGNVIIVGGNSISPTVTERPGATVTFASGSVLADVWGNATEVHVVGSAGRIYRRLAGTWAQMISPTTLNLAAVSGSGPGNAFAVGQNGVILLYSGGAWSLMTTNNASALDGVYAASPTDAFAVGSGGVIMHYDGANWTNMASGTIDVLKGVWGSSGTDVFAVGDGGTILHYNGTSWRFMRSPTTMPLYAVSGTGPGDVFAAGEGGTLLRFDGLTWSTTTSRTTDRMGSQSGTFALSAGLAGSDDDLLEWKRSCVATESSCTDGNDEDCDGRYDCGDADCAANVACTGGAACAAANEALMCDMTEADSTSAGLRSIAQYGCDDVPEHGREKMYTFTRNTTGPVTLTLTATADLDLIVLATGAGGVCEPRNPGCIVSSSTLGGNETVTFDATADAVYYVVVDGFGAAAGNFNLDVSCP